MFFKSLLRYKWYALSSLLMTSLMIASSLLLPWFLKHILDALQLSLIHISEPTRPY